MNRAALNFLPISLIFVANPLKADTVTLAGRPAFENVQVLDCRGGKIAFRGVSGEVLRKSLAEVQQIETESTPDLNTAERLRAGGELREAIHAYARVAEKDRWVKAVALRRTIACANAIPDPDVATRALLAILEADNELEPGLARLRFAPPGSDANAAALKRIRGANLRGNDALIVLQLELTILEDPDGVAGAFRAPVGADGASDHEGAAVDDRMFGRSKMRFGGHLLAHDSLLRVALLGLVDEGKFAAARRRYAAARPFVPVEAAVAWNLLDARLLIGEGKAAQAADRLVSLRSAANDAESGAEAVYDLGLAQERLGQYGLAADLYRELAARETAPAEWRTRARAAADRLEKPERTEEPATRP